MLAIFVEGRETGTYSPLLSWPFPALLSQLKTFYPLGPVQLGISLCSQVTNPHPPTFKTLTGSSPSDDLTQLLGERQLFVLIHVKVWTTLLPSYPPSRGICL